MDEIKVKIVPTEQMTQVYMMGFSTWNLGKSESDYLDFCYHSKTFNDGKWYGLYRNDELVSSLIQYQFSSDIYGFGSIATKSELRGQGLAPKLIQYLIDQLSTGNPAASLFIYSDIEPSYYQQFGFIRMPQASQKYPKSVCMVRGINIEKFLSGDIKPPDYF